MVILYKIHIMIKNITFLSTLLFSLLHQEISAQFRMPAASSLQTISQEFGLGTVTVRYSRPNIKGRNVFTDLAPYGEVWRTGANNATVISFTDEVSLEGNPVKAGDYALFSIPGKDGWTIILNKGTDQWGAYSYKQADDVLRFDVKPRKRNEKEETFTVSFSEVMPASAVMNLVWDDVQVAIRMSADIDSKIMSGIEEAMKSDQKPYFEAAQYYYENGKDLNKALEWVSAAETTDLKAPWYKYWKAKIQLKAGDKAGASASAKAGIQAAQDMSLAEYIRLNNAILDEISK